jgi:hypothetical protein
MGLNAAFETDSQLAHTGEPRMRTLHDPTMTAQSIIALDSLASNSGRDASLVVSDDPGSYLCRRLCRHAACPANVGRPGLPAIGGSASTSTSNAIESCRLAPVTQYARGIPLR